jgi:hypothetical protein
MKRVTAPDGARWSVRRQWAPRLHGRGLRSRMSSRRANRRRKRSAKSDDTRDRWYDHLDVPFDGLDELAWVVLAIAVIVVLVLFGIPLILAVIDALLFLVLLISGVVARLLLRRPWTVEATSDRGDRLLDQVAGWRASGVRRNEMAERLSLGFGKNA